jgi:uncharacterized protein (DUF608 family)
LPVESRPDPAWLKRRIGTIEKYADRMIAMDVDGDGLCESKEGRTNWWDCIPWNGNDAYSSAIAYRAFRSMADLEHRLGDEAKSSRYRQRAEAIFGKMLDGYRDGTFQNGIGNGGDWKQWNGDPSGYEGLLVDAYYRQTEKNRSGDRRGEDACLR